MMMKSSKASFVLLHYDYNHFMAPLDFVQNYPGELVPER